MYRELVCRLSIILAISLGLASTVAASPPGLVGWWAFDEGAGTVARDGSGNGHDGTFEGSPKWTSPGWNGTGSCLEFGGNADRVTVEPFDLAGTGITLAAWVNVTSFQDDARLISKAEGSGTADHYWAMIMSGGGENNLEFRLRTDSGGTTRSSAPDSEDLQTGEWTHIAVTWDAADPFMRFYKNAQEIFSQSKAGSAVAAHPDIKIALGNQSASVPGDGGIRPYGGLLDDVVVYDRALDVEELEALMEGLKGVPTARSPDPEDGSLLEATWVSLIWAPGQWAVSHDVYLGESFDDVNAGTGDTFRGNQTTDTLLAGFPGFAYPNGLAPGTTYYWRVDEVNDADPNSPWRGDVWSFTVPSRKAYNPDPIDDGQFVAQDVELTWTAGFDSKLHTVYFGDDRDAVGSATGGMATMSATHTPGSLETEKTYYWRVDEFDGFTTHKGDLWSFTTVPNVPITDPSLLGWWKLDEGQGTTAVDWSGHGNHGRLNGAAQWAEGYDGGALDLEYGNTHDGVAVTAFDVGSGGITLAAWVKPESFSQNDGRIITKASGTGSNDHLWMLSTIANGPDFTLRLRLKTDDGQDTATLIANEGAVVVDQWTHAAATWDGTNMIIYKDGVEVAREAKTGTAVATDPSLAVAIGNHLSGTTGNRPWDGMIDDVRVYDKALNPDELLDAMRGDPFVAWGPSPSNGATVGIDDATPLSWSPGESASQHDVYFGLYEDAVAAADASTADIYRGRQSGTDFTPAEGVEWGGGPYYWRVDELKADGAISKGRIWSFVVADFVPVEDFESYTDDDAAGEAIWQSWIDGFGVATNGSQVGYLLPPYAEQTIVHEGSQSMPLSYDNTSGVTNSEAEMTLTAPRDWAKSGVTELSLWFRGSPASVGSFVEGPVATYTMTATGADIWNDADEFHYAYRTLSGVGSIEAQVLNVQNTNTWAKAGVMIRDTLDANSKFAAVFITPGNGCRFQGRLDTGIGASSDTSVATDEQIAITAPYWIRLERDAGGNFSGFYSSNGTAWQPMTWNPRTISMSATVYVGLALTSHNNNATCEARFSNVRTTGTVSAQWTSQDIGIASNAAEPLYVAISNSTGAAAVVAHGDPDVATTVTWTEWVIDLQEFASQGINLADVDKIAVGLGSKSNLAASGGSGVVYFDDFRLYRPRNVGP